MDETNWGNAQDQTSRLTEGGLAIPDDRRRIQPMAASETPSVRSLLETKSRVLIMNAFARSSARIPITHPTLKQGFYPPSDAYFNKFLVPDDTEPTACVTPRENRFRGMASPKRSLTVGPTYTFRSDVQIEAYPNVKSA